MGSGSVVGVGWGRGWGRTADRNSKGSGLTVRISDPNSVCADACTDRADVNRHLSRGIKGYAVNCQRSARRSRHISQNMASSGAGCVARSVTNKTCRIIIKFRAAHGSSGRNDVRAGCSLRNGRRHRHNRRRRRGGAKLNGSHPPGVCCIAIFLDSPESLVVARVNIGS